MDMEKRKTGVTKVIPEHLLVKWPSLADPLLIDNLSFWNIAYNKDVL